jgi:hypothetical protein
MSPARRVGVALGLALALSATFLGGASMETAAESPERDGQAHPDWLSSLADWLVPVSRWTDSAAVSAVFPDDTPSVNKVRLKPRPKPGAFSMNLYAPGDFVSQQTIYWCVAGSLQTMMNIIDDGQPDRSAKFQKRLHFEARDLDRDGDRFWRDIAGKARWKKGLHGLGLDDWAGTLTANGYGEYDVDRAPTLKQAIRKAARSIRTTGRPAGLVVWRGAHAWVMSGFTATADPAYTTDFKIRKVFIQDPWYPRVSSIWGASRPPNAAVTLRQLSQDYLRYNRPSRKQPMRDGKYMLVLPELPPNTVAR